MNKHLLLRYKYFSITAIFLLGFMGTGCSPEDPDVSNQGSLGVVTVMNGLDQEGKFSTMYDALRDLGLSSRYNGSGPDYAYTLFAPSNAAWENFLANYDGWGSIGDIPNSLLTELVQYHFVPGTFTSGALGTSLTTDQGEDLAISGTTINGSSNVVNADLLAINGAVHEIDQVLIPSTFPSTSIAGTASSLADFSSLVAAVSRFPDLLDAIDGGNGVFSVLAPTNVAFTNALGSLGYATLADVPDPLLRTILEYHVIAERELLFDDLASSLVTFGGEEVLVDTNVVTIRDVWNTNGVIQAVNEVLVPPSLGTLAGDVLTNPDFSILAAAIVEADLVPALAGEGPFTVFAPNNAAFANAGITDLSTFSKDSLAAILTYHVLPMEVASGDIMTSYPMTLNGQSLMVDVAGGVTVDGVTVIDTDIEATNGVIHVIDNVLLPTDQDIVDVALGANPEFTSLVAALQKAELVGALQGDGPFTVFAPTNAAFDALFADLEVTGLDDLTKEQLEPILLYHVFSGSVFSTGLPTGELRSLSDEAVILDGNNAIVTTTSGQDIDLTATGMLNLRASNGVIHVVNTVLLPASE